jgi:enterochelin esterase-like enzyme
MKKSKIKLRAISWGLIFIIFCTEKGLSQTNVAKSVFITDTVYSQYLKEPRLINVYLPSDYSSGNKYPVVYTTDGQIIATGNYVKILDSLIENKLIPPIILVGVYSNEKTVKGSIYVSYRQYEYIETWGNNDSVLGNRFGNHLQFFVNEIIPYIESHFSTKKERNGRLFYGCSNGGGFGITLGLKYPALFSDCICFSPLGGNVEQSESEKNMEPYFYLSYGAAEAESFIEAYKTLDDTLTKININHLTHVSTGGHDRKKWEEEFSKTVVTIFKNKTLN